MMIGGTYEEHSAKLDLFANNETNFYQGWDER